MTKSFRGHPLYSFDELSDDAKLVAVSSFFPYLPHWADVRADHARWVESEIRNAVLACHRDKVRESFSAVWDIRYRRNSEGPFKLGKDLRFDSDTWAFSTGSDYMLADFHEHIESMVLSPSIETEVKAFMEPVMPSLKAKVPEFDIEWPSQIEAVAQDYAWEWSDEDPAFSEYEILTTACKAYCEAMKAAACDIAFSPSFDIGFYVDFLSFIFAEHDDRFDRFGHLFIPGQQYLDPGVKPMLVLFDRRHACSFEPAVLN